VSTPLAIDGELTRVFAHLCGEPHPLRRRKPSHGGNLRVARRGGRVAGHFT
jgi:hypothetical protein